MIPTAMLLVVWPLFAQAEAPAIDVPDDTKAAVAAVDRFFAALKAGELEKAGAELDPEVWILESGGVERSAAEYLGGHAKGDAAFLKDAHHKLLRRKARTSGKFAWVASESELHVQRDGKPATIVSTETMILRSDHAGWKIVHIHWSSRTRK
ncbi:MAG: nuclear transport factor 2 family protein [Steroidobacteraceae bacterium]|nr:nuclear transport factor 2 family protein [Steroidobacteraceae bacterium]